MVPLPATSIRAIRGAPADRVRWSAWVAERAADAAATPLQTLKSAETVAVYAATIGPDRVVLKCWLLAGIAHRAYAALRSTRGSRQWRGARRLAALGIETPRSLALLRGRAEDRLVEVLIMERAEGRTLLEHMAQPTLTVRAQHRVVEALAGQCAAMARAGLFNRDHKPSNLVVLEANDRTARLAVLDAVAIRPLPAGPRGLAAAPLERLILEAIGMGIPPRRALVARFVRTWLECTARAERDPRAARRTLWTTISARIRAHGDPTPTDNPLSVAV